MRPQAYSKTTSRKGSLHRRILTFSLLLFCHDVYAREECVCASLLAVRTCSCQLELLPSLEAVKDVSGSTGRNIPRSSQRLIRRSTGGYLCIASEQFKPANSLTPTQLYFNVEYPIVIKRRCINLDMRMVGWVRLRGPNSVRNFLQLPPQVDGLMFWIQLVFSFIRF